MSPVSVRLPSLGLAVLTAGCCSFALAPHEARAAEPGAKLVGSFHGTTLDGVAPRAELRVNGHLIDTFDVTNATSQPREFELAEPLGQGDHVDIRFTNDAARSPLEDRNLHVDSITAGGVKVVPDEANSQYDLGATWAKASDGLSVRAGSPTEFVKVDEAIGSQAAGW